MTYIPVKLSTLTHKAGICQHGGCRRLLDPPAEEVASLALAGRSQAKRLGTDI